LIFLLSVFFVLFFLQCFLRREIILIFLRGHYNRSFLQSFFKFILSLLDFFLFLLFFVWLSLRFLGLLFANFNQEFTLLNLIKEWTLTNLILFNG
jgi:hypothetical protein